MKRFYESATIFLVMLSVIYATILHNKMINQPYAGFALDAENRIQNIEQGIPHLQKGMKLLGFSYKNKYYPVRSTFEWMKLLQASPRRLLTLHVQVENRKLKVPHLIKSFPVWPKFAYSLTSGLLVLFCAIFLWLKRNENSIYLFMIVTITATYVLILAFNNLDTISPIPPLLLGFLGFNLLAPPSLLLFFLRYPQLTRAGRKPWPILIYIPAVMAFVVTAIYYYRLTGNPTPENQDLLLFAGRIYIPGINLAYGLGTVVALIFSYFHSKSIDRRRVLLIIYGIFIMLLILTSWVFLYSRESAIKQISGGPDLIFILFSVICVFLTMSSSRQMSIKLEGLMSRSLAYGIITLGIILLYIGLSVTAGLVLTHFLGLTSKTVTILAAVVATAGLFSLKDLVSSYVDRMFFRTRYLYSETVNEIGQRISNIMEIPRLLGEILRIITKSLDLHGAAAFLPDSSRKKYNLIKIEGEFPIPEGFSLSNLNVSHISKIAWNGTVYCIDPDSPDEISQMLYSAGFGAVVLLVFQSEVVGVIGLPSKKEDNIFTRDDLELLNSVGKQSGLAVRNAISYTTIMKLNENLTRQKNEIEKLKSRLEIENTMLQKAVSAPFGEIIGRSSKMVEIHELIQKIAPTDASVLILGESGTGKELIARTIHRLSKRSDRHLVTVNCAAIPENLLESELFGHVKGAFTGAVRKKAGQMELADKSTIFLDEIGELPLSLQPKILRAIQEGEITPLGSEKSIKIDVRLITATNRNLESMVEEGKFREDLYYRINVVPVHIPPLRARSEDVNELASHFIEIHSRRMGKKITGMTKHAAERLRSYNWPGNVRELGNVIERAVALSSRDVLDTEILLPVLSITSDKSRESEPNIQNPDGEPSNNEHNLTDDIINLPYREAMDSFKRIYIESILKKVNGNRSEAARIIGLQRPYLHKLIKELGIDESNES